MKKAKCFIILLLMVHSSILCVAQQFGIVKGYSESIAKSYFDSNSNSLDPIEGIWQTNEGAKYAVEKDVENGIRQKGKYRVVVLDHWSKWMKQGEIQAFITDGSSDALYSMKYLPNMLLMALRLAQSTILLQEMASV